jgi:hypothetical protein
LVCLIQAGVFSVSATVSVQNLLAVSPSFFSFVSQSFNSASVGNFNPHKSVSSIVFGGFDFGTFRLSHMGRVFGTSCEMTAWSSNSAVSCLPSRSLSFLAFVSVSASSVVGSLTSILSVNEPSLSALASTNSFGRNNQKVTILGKSLGAFDFSQRMQLGFTLCEKTGWTSDSSVNTNPLGNIGASLPVAFTAGIRMGSLSVAGTYDTCVVSSLVGINIPLYGGDSIIFWGDFGKWSASGSAAFSASSSEASFWVSESTLLSLPSRGFLGSVYASVSVGLHSNTRTDVMSYDKAEALGGFTVTNFPTAGLVDVVFNTGLFPDRMTPKARIAGTQCGTSVWFSQTSLLCRESRGFSAAFPGKVVLTAGPGVSTASDVVSYNSGMLSCASVGNAPSVGNRKTQLGGVFLGLFSPSPQMRVGVTSCRATSWSSDTTIFCNIGSGLSGADKKAVVSMSSVSSTSSTFFSYDFPIIVAWKQDQEFDPEILSFVGRNFGVEDFSLQAFVGSTLCEFTSWIADSSIVCKLNRVFSSSNLSALSPDSNRLCSRCAPTEIAAGCSGTSLGSCEGCGTCPAGLFRDGCIPGTYFR